MLNVHERIKIKYGEPYGLTVTSEENKGTNMILKFPLRGGVVICTRLC